MLNVSQKRARPLRNIGKRIHFVCALLATTCNPSKVHGSLGLDGKPLPQIEKTREAACVTQLGSSKAVGIILSIKKTEPYAICQMVTFCYADFQTSLLHRSEFCAELSDVVIFAHLREIKLFLSSLLSYHGWAL